MVQCLRVCAFWWVRLFWNVFCQHLHRCLSAKRPCRPERRTPRFFLVFVLVYGLIYSEFPKNDARKWEDKRNKHTRLCRCFSGEQHTKPGGKVTCEEMQFVTSCSLRVLVNAHIGRCATRLSRLPPRERCRGVAAHLTRCLLAVALGVSERQTKGIF